MIGRSASYTDGVSDSLECTYPNHDFSSYRWNLWLIWAQRYFCKFLESTDGVHVDAGPRRAIGRAPDS